MARASVVPPAPTAIILAAGLGTRLQASEPKGFVEMGGTAIIARSVSALQSAGISEFVFVIGWRGESYRRWCAAHLPAARCIMNSEYATTGSLLSLRLALEALGPRDVVVAESDLLYERRAARLIANARGASILVSGFTDSRDEVWAYADGSGNLRELTKTRREGLSPVGELVGLSRFSADVALALVGAASALPAAAHYEEGLNAIAARHPIHLEHVPDLAWCEIDDAGHLARARELVWPRIRAADTETCSPA